MAFYGSDTETYYVASNGSIWLVASPDFYKGVTPQEMISMRGERDSAWVELDSSILDPERFEDASDIEFEITRRAEPPTEPHWI